MRRRAEYAQNPPLKMPTSRFHPEPEVYQQAIIATIQRIDPNVSKLVQQFDAAVDGGALRVAGEKLDQLEKGLMIYTTLLK